MLDYEEVKEFFANKLAEDFKGRGRFESAFYHTIVFAYRRGLADGAEPAGAQAQDVVYCPVSTDDRHGE